MNTSDNHAFVNQLLVYTLVMICLSGSIGLQPVKGKGFVAMRIFVGFAVAVVLGLFAALVWSATH